MPLELKIAGKTDRGLVRPGNEDCLHVDEQNAVFAVCDGMGGHQAGEVASLTACETIRQLWDSFRSDLAGDDRLSLGQSLPGTGDLLLKAIRLANRRIFRKAATESDLAGMGTTIVAMAFEGNVMSVAHVGDSRAYRLEAGGLRSFTRDHSWVSEMQVNHSLSEQEALAVVGRNVITRALGVRETVEVDCRLVKVNPGEIYLLCSDGLCGYADDDEIFAVADKFRSDLKRMVESLVQLANDRGGADNVSVLAVQVKRVAGPINGEEVAFTLPPESSEQLQSEDEWLAKLETARTEPSPRRERSLLRRRFGKYWLALIFSALLLLWIALIYIQSSR
ncbi:MAG TPA: Stp1/IreP family PP2C-type Ser/Thr phosphatase [Candidatus Deferrimicrobium sp.]|nr:Stp1/IreP family PP2C-type Ser/Thr phosphatase [Candidatus Deferrimicrobium sp.]